MKRLLLFFCVWMVIGCAAMPMGEERQVISPPIFEKPNTGQSLVFFYREWTFAGVGIGYYTYDGNDIIGASWNECYFAKYLSPGQHTFWGDIQEKRFLTVNLEAGNMYYIRMGLENKPLAPDFSIVIPEIAIPVISKINYCNLITPHAPVPTPTGAP